MSVSDGTLKICVKTLSQGQGLNIGFPQHWEVRQQVMFVTDTRLLGIHWLRTTLNRWNPVAARYLTLGGTSHQLNRYKDGKYVWTTHHFVALSSWFGKILYLFVASIVQLVGVQTCNRGVPGSNPSAAWPMLSPEERLFTWHFPGLIGDGH